MTAFVAKAAGVQKVLAPWGSNPPVYVLTATNLDNGQPVGSYEYANPNVPIPDLAEGRYRFSLVAVDSITRQPLVAAREIDQAIVQPVVEMPDSFSVVPA